jgi:hypothetical protein
MKALRPKTMTCNAHSVKLRAVAVAFPLIDLAAAGAYCLGENQAASRDATEAARSQAVAVLPQAGN